MSLEAARDLSFADLLRVLSDKFDSECTRLRESALSPKLVVSTPRSTHLSECEVKFDPSDLHRSKASKPKRTMF
jgi:hypothetical protein